MISVETDGKFGNAHNRHFYQEIKDLELYDIRIKINEYIIDS
jgi:hypothetical protein